MQDLALLRLMQLFDSQFPVGAFAHSGGLETYAHEGLDAKGLRELLANEIALGWGRGDLPAALLAWRGAVDPRAAELLDQLALRVESYKVVRTVRDASLRLGARMLALAHRLYPEATASLEIARPHHAVVVGALGRRLGLPARELLLAYGQSAMAGALAAATRCMSLSPGRAQEILIDLQALLTRAVDRVLAAPEDDLFTCTPALDVRRHEHAFLYTRLFQS